MVAKSTDNLKNMLEDQKVIFQHTETSLDLKPSITDDFLTQASESYKRGDLAHACELLEFAKNLFQKKQSDESMLELLVLLGRIYRDQGINDKAEEVIIQALNLAEELQNHKTRVDALNLLASVFSINGYDTTALEFLYNALNLATEHQFDKKQANILTNIGRIHLQLGNYPESIKYNKRAFTIFEELDPTSRDSATNLINIGKTYLQNSDFENAKIYFLKTLELSEKLQDDVVKSVAFNNIGFTFLSSKKYKAALSHFIQGLRLAKEKQLKQFEIHNLDGIAQVYEAQGNNLRAAKIFLKTLKVAQDLSLPESEVDALLGLGRNYVSLKKCQEAVPYLVKGLELAQTLEHRKNVFELHKLLASAYEEQNKSNLALFHYKKFHDIEKQVFNEKSEEAIHKLTVKFDLERAERNAKEYLSQKQIAEKAAEEAERLVKIRTHELESSQVEIVMRLAQAAELRDEDTGEHTFRVGRNAAAIAYCLGWAIEDVKLLYLASRLHDVGKIGISDTILLKPGKLTDDEFELMRQHSVIGAKILSHGESSLLRMAERIALAHHERWDGYGYPNKLAGNNIPICARIVSVADVLDALTHERPYKKAWAVEDALEEIKDNAGKQFDPKIVEIALTVFDTKNGISPTSAPITWDDMLVQFKDLFSKERELATSLVNTTNWGQIQ